ncbi:glycoside hydrolase family 99-like domain-containing protein [Paraburkholderia sp. A3RO-2L]|uniref:glycoside hydrolase family 99-like domain-containing protein n=1 Tax=Paraburkholderia sp. A3RO-2L TaxID=3028376 RepID=UPI003DA9BF1E
MSGKLFVVLGMHRSGTSALTRGLQTMGIGLGDFLYPAQEGVNEEGFWEDMDVVNLNDEMLSLLGSSWHTLQPVTDDQINQLRDAGYMTRAADLLCRKVAEHPVFGVKDPRLCKMLRFWHEVFLQCDLDVGYVIALRNPLSVIDSLSKRNGFSKEKTYYMWLEHVLAALTDSNVRARGLVVDYDRLMTQPRVELGRIAEIFGLQIDEAAVNNYATQFLREDLRHASYEADRLESDGECPRAVIEVFEIAKQLAEGKLAIDSDYVREVAARRYEQLQEASALLALVDRLALNVEQCETSLDEQKRQFAQSLDEQERKFSESLDEQGRKFAESLDEQKRKFAESEEATGRLLDERIGEITELEQTVRGQAVEIRELTDSVRELNVMRQKHEGDIAQLVHDLVATRASTSWRVTQPLRFAGLQAKRAKLLLKILPAAIQRGGGIGPCTEKAVAILRREGVRGVKHRLRSTAISVAHGPTGVPLYEGGEAALGGEAAISARPYYLNPFYKMQQPNREQALSIAVHYHVFYEDLVGEGAAYLRNIPCPFDLYVSTTPSAQPEVVRNVLRSALPNAREIVVEAVPNRGRDLAPLIVQFGHRLAQYDAVCHIHTKKSPHSGSLGAWRDEIMELLFGAKNSDGQSVEQILDLIKSGAKVVYPEPNLTILTDRTGWSDNYAEAARLLHRYTEYRIENFPVVEFPQGSMFWARSECIGDLLKMPLQFDDFPAEPIPADGTIAHALERLILLVTSRFEGENIRLQRGDSDVSYSFYEEQLDFSADIDSEAPKVLAYYLPQFHPTPENDEWHGAGFTEWTKVRAANPLFPGHFQQHIPHEDIGYYLLDTPATLEKQAQLMKRAGVFGQIFYHYWFTGRMILEKPAAMLLENPSIDMPFCFCWANENWTRRWDGNESEILLGQQYSEQDALAFIQYLIPFFKDSRYIRVDDRPVLLVYRPSSIPDARQYLDIWAAECARHGLRAPYVVAVLTRGATDPREFGMDAGTERVLHDWTDGKAPEISQELGTYDKFEGSVLRYDDVAQVYMSEAESKPFTWFRSIVPVWDNTARYGSAAYVVHGSTPERFQQWMQHLVEYSRKQLASDRRFIVVNAWNEWAEGAHLEPDSRYGYAYLNSVGRALTNVPFDAAPRADKTMLENRGVYIRLSDYAKRQLEGSELIKNRFIKCLGRSSLFSACRVGIDQPDLEQSMRSAFPSLPIHRMSEGQVDFHLMIGRISYFSDQTLEAMVKMAAGCKTSVIVANSYGLGDEMAPVHSNGSIDRSLAYGAPLMLLPEACRGVYKNFKMCVDARCFDVLGNRRKNSALPVVTTIIRFHKNGDLELLENALLCLLAMRDCIVRPLIAAQDLSEQQKGALRCLLEAYPWSAKYPPVVQYFHSDDGAGDLRSRMMNEALKSVDTRYAAFLDYDDLMLPTAYSSLVARLEKTGKAVTFGRVYQSLYQSKRARIVERRRTYEFGSGYDEFLNRNHAPIHSFLLDMRKLDLSRLVYFDDQQYMEDYLLTLQIFSAENTDWESLANSIYVGDYIHSIDRAHTLAMLDGPERQGVLVDPAFKKCEARIEEMRQRVMQNRSARAELCGSTDS